MMMMNWTHSSKAVVLVVVLAVAFATVGTASAISISGFGSAPDSAQVGEEVTVEVELSELYGDDVPDDNWTLSGQTALNNADWTVIVRDVAGDEVTRTDVTGESFEQQIVRENDHATVDITVTGEVPELSEFNYEDRSVEQAVAMELAQVTEGDERAELPDGTHMLHRYNSESQQARQTIDEAQQAVDQSGGTGSDSVQDAITFYNNGEFESAIDAAEDAQSSAQGQEQTRQFLLIGAAAVVLIAVLGGGIYYWRQSQQDTSKLR
jgi:hypothetical protein